MNAQFVLSYPNRYKYVYVYGVKDGTIIFTKQRDENTWELPGGEIESGEIPEEAAEREFLEETGYRIHLIQSVEADESNKLVFIGKIGNKVRGYDKKEIAEIRFFNFKRIPKKESLSFPHTDYEKILSKITLAGIG